MIELIAYTKPGWVPRLRVAPRERDWMEMTGNKSGYWCLPLSIANTHGWELLSPCTFRAMWSGDYSPAGVQIEMPPNVRDAATPCSIFCHGVLTFHTPAVFRTTHGYNLAVGGSPNRFKDAIQALSGIIETDWAPFTFTMNWKFTRAHQWITFEENEPFCFLSVVQRGLVEQVEPSIRPFEQVPELLRDHNNWTVSRDAFHAQIRSCPAHNVSDMWQKHYMKGITVTEGSKPFPEHQTKLNVREFTDKVLA